MKRKNTKVPTNTKKAKPRAARTRGSHGARQRCESQNVPHSWDDGANPRWIPRAGRATSSRPTVRTRGRANTHPRPGERLLFFNSSTIRLLEIPPPLSHYPARKVLLALPADKQETRVRLANDVTAAPLPVRLSPGMYRRLHTMQQPISPLSSL